MKNNLILMLCSFLLGDGYSIPVANAQTSAQTQLSDIENVVTRANKLRLEAEARAMEQCTTERIIVPLPSWAPGKGEEIVEEMVSITWSGACVDGKRDGDGVLTWIEERTSKTRINETTNLEMRLVKTNRAEGRFVKGQRLGLWCMTYKGQVYRDGQELQHSTSTSGCSVFAGHTNPLTGNYRKEPDGRWREYTDAPTDSILAAGTLEAQSAKMLADAAAGKTDLKVDLRVKNQSLDDLVRGSTIVLAPSAVPISLKDKRIAVVLSSQTIRELERFTRERQALIEASAGLRGEAAVERATFIQASDPDRLLANILKTVRKYVKEVQPAEDLEILKREGVDYALVVDWKSLTRFDQLGKFDSFPVPSAEEERQGLGGRQADAMAKGTILYGDVMSGFLISPDLNAVKHFPANWNAVRKSSRRKHSGDQGYLYLLALHFVHGLGNGRDDLGSSTQALDYFLQHLADNPSKTQ